MKKTGLFLSIMAIFTLAFSGCIEVSFSGSSENTTSIIYVLAENTTYLALKKNSVDSSKVSAAITVLEAVKTSIESGSITLILPDSIYDDMDADVALAVQSVFTILTSTYSIDFSSDLNSTELTYVYAAIDGIVDGGSLYIAYVEANASDDTKDLPKTEMIKRAEELLRRQNY